MADSHAPDQDNPHKRPNPSPFPPPRSDQDPAKKSRLNSPEPTTDDFIMNFLKAFEPQQQLNPSSFPPPGCSDPDFSEKERKKQSDNGASKLEEVYKAFACKECFACGFGDHMTNECPIKGTDEYFETLSRKYEQVHHPGLDWDPSKPLPEGYGWASYSSAQPERKDFAMKMYCYSCHKGGHLSHKCPKLG